MAGEKIEGTDNASSMEGAAKYRDLVTKPSATPGEQTSANTFPGLAEAASSESMDDAVGRQSAEQAKRRMDEFMQTPEGEQITGLRKGLQELDDWLRIERGLRDGHNMSRADHAREWDVASIKKFCKDNGVALDGEALNFSRLEVDRDYLAKAADQHYGNAAGEDFATTLMESGIRLGDELNVMRSASESRPAYIEGGWKVDRIFPGGVILKNSEGFSKGALISDLVRWNSES